MKKQALKETATFAIMLIAFISLVMSFTSCSKEHDPKPKNKKDIYSISISINASIATGLYNGDFAGDIATAEQYMSTSKPVQAGEVTSVQVNKGQTLFVQTESDKVLNIVVTKNGEELLTLTRSPNGPILIFSNK